MLRMRFYLTRSQLNWGVSARTRCTFGLRVKARSPAEASSCRTRCLSACPTLPWRVASWRATRAAAPRSRSNRSVSQDAIAPRAARWRSTGPLHRTCAPTPLRSSCLVRARVRAALVTSRALTNAATDGRFKDCACCACAFI